MACPGPAGAEHRVAHVGGRPQENAHVGLRIDDPVPDLTALARSQDLEGIGPVTAEDDLAAVLDQAVKAIQSGRPAVVDVRVERGYGSSTARAISGAG